MRKAKIEIVTNVEDETVNEKYICQVSDEQIVYRDRQKTETVINYTEQYADLERIGFVNYRLRHDGASAVSSNFATTVEGNPFSMELRIENKYYNLDKCGKILSIEIHFIREDGCLVKQQFKVEEK